MGNCLVNCVTSSILSVLLCKSGCKIDNVAGKIAYFPPNPPSYNMRMEEGTLKITLLDRVS
jgi:hypothetical protein